MKTLQEKYTSVLKEEFSKKQFVRDARLLLPGLITQFNGFEDTVQILKNKGMIIEEVKQPDQKENTKSEPEKVSEDLLQEEKIEKEEIHGYSMEALQRAIDIELEKAGVDTAIESPSEAVYKKAKTKAQRNLEKNPLYYLNLIAGESNRVKKHDKMVHVKRGEGAVDTFNGMKKGTLKEGVFSRFDMNVSVLGYKGSIKKSKHGWMLYDKKGSPEEAGPFDTLESLLSYYDLQIEDLRGPYAEKLKKEKIKRDEEIEKENLQEEKTISEVDDGIKIRAQKYYNAGKQYFEKGDKDKATTARGIALQLVGRDEEMFPPYEMEEQNIGSNGDFEHNQDMKRRAYSYYDAGERMFTQGNKELAEKLRQKALKIGEWLDWGDRELPPYDEHLQEWFNRKKEVDSPLAEELTPYNLNLIFSVPQRDPSQENLEKLKNIRLDMAERRMPGLAKQLPELFDRSQEVASATKPLGGSSIQGIVPANWSTYLLKGKKVDTGYMRKAILSRVEQSVETFKGREEIREGFKKIIRRILEEHKGPLNEAATNNLAALAESYSDFEGMQQIINDLENIVTDIEAYYAKTSEKLQKIYDNFENIKNPDGILVGALIGPAIERDFLLDLKPVLNKGFTKGLSMPKAKILSQADIEAAKERGDLDTKDTVFKPLSEEKKKKNTKKK